MSNISKNKYSKNSKKKTKRHSNGNKKVKKRDILKLKTKKEKIHSNKKLNIRLKKNYNTIKLYNLSKKNKTEKQYAGAPLDFLKKGFSQLQDKDVAIETYLQDYLDSVNELNSPKLIQSFNKSPGNLDKAFTIIDNNLTSLISQLYTDKSLTKTNEFIIRENIIRSINILENVLKQFIQTNQQRYLTGSNKYKKNVFGKEVLNDYYKAAQNSEQILNRIKIKASEEANKLGELQSQPDIIPNIKKISENVRISQTDFLLENNFNHLKLLFNAFLKIFNSKTIQEWKEVFTSTQYYTSNKQVISEKNKFTGLLAELVKASTDFYKEVNNVSSQLTRFANTSVYGGPQYKPSNIDYIIQILNEYISLFSPFIKKLSLQDNLNLIFSTEPGNLFYLLIKQYDEIEIEYNQLLKLQKEANESLQKAQAKTQAEVQPQAPVALAAVSERTISPAIQDKEPGIFSTTQESEQDKALKEQRLKEATEIQQEALEKERQRLLGLQKLKLQQETEKRMASMQPVNREAVFNSPQPLGLAEPLQPEIMPIQPQPQPQTQQAIVPVQTQQALVPAVPKPQQAIVPAPYIQRDTSAGVYGLLKDADEDEESQLQKSVTPLPLKKQPINIEQPNEDIEQAYQTQLSAISKPKPILKDVLAPLRESMIRRKKQYTPLVSQTSGLFQEDEAEEESRLQKIKEQPEFLPSEKEVETGRLLQQVQKPGLIQKVKETLSKPGEVIPKTPVSEENVPKFSTKYQPLVETGSPLPEPEVVKSKPLSAAQRGLLDQDEDLFGFEQLMSAPLQKELPPKSKVTSQSEFIPQPVVKPRGFPMQLPSSSVVRATPPSQDLTELPIPEGLPSVSLTQPVSTTPPIPYGVPIKTGIPIPITSTKVVQSQNLINRLQVLRTSIKDLRNEIGQTTNTAEKQLKDTTLEKCTQIINNYITALSNINQQFNEINKNLEKTNTDTELNTYQSQKMQLYNEFRNLQDKYLSDLQECQAEKDEKDQDEDDTDMQEMREKLEQIKKPIAELDTGVEKAQQEQLKKMLEIRKEDLPELPSKQLESVVTSVSSAPTDDGANKVTITVKVPRVFPTQMTGSISGTAAELFQQLMSQPYRNISMEGQQEQTKTTTIGTDGKIQSEENIQTTTKVDEQPSLIDLSIPEQESSSLAPVLQPEESVKESSSIPPPLSLESQEQQPIQRQLSPIQEEQIRDPTYSSASQTPALQQYLQRKTKEGIQKVLQSKFGVSQESLEKGQRFLSEGPSSFIPKPSVSKLTEKALTSLSQTQEQLQPSLTLGELSRAESTPPSSPRISPIPSSSSSSFGKQPKSILKPSSTFKEPQPRTTRSGRQVKPPVRFQGGNNINDEFKEHILNFSNSSEDDSDFIKNIVQTIKKNKFLNKTPKSYHKVNKKDLKNITLKVF